MPLKNAGRRSYKQQYLDLGQRRWGLVECRICGMCFEAGLESEEKSHARFCGSLKVGVEFRCVTLSSFLPIIVRIIFLGLF